MTMKIENYSDKNGYSADTFTFPYNPRVFDDVIDTNMTLHTIPYSKTHIAITNAGIDPKSIVLTGHFSGTNKFVNYNSLAKHITEAKLKKLYFADDRFYICLGRQIKMTNSAGRTNFVDYVATFIAPIGLVFGDTQRSDTYSGGSWADGSVTNQGYAATYIEKIEIELGSSGSAGDTLTITDNHNHGFVVRLEDYSSGDTVTVYLVTLAEVGSSETWSIEYLYCWQDTGSGSQLKRYLASGKKSMFLVLEVGENVSNISVTGTPTISSYTVYFRDGYFA